MGEEIKFATSALAEYVTDANEVLEFKMVIELFNVGKQNLFLSFRCGNLMTLEIPVWHLNQKCAIRYMVTMKMYLAIKA